MSQVAINILTVWATVIVGAFTFLGIVTTVYGIQQLKK